MSDKAPVILVIEDEDAIADLLRSLLEEEGYTVITAPNGREGLLRLQEEGRVDLVMSDIMMPQVDGREVARTIRADAAYDRIPLMLMSSVGAGIIAGVPQTAFLAKPFDLETLFALIARLLPDSPDA